MIDGFEIEGVVVGPASGDPLTPPLAGRTCVMYELTVDVFTYGMLSPWVNQAYEARAIPFELDGGGDRVIVEPAGAIARLDVDRHVEPGRGRASPIHRAILSRHRVPAGGDLRFREAALEPGDVVRVRGPAVREVDPVPPRDRGYRDHAAMRIRVASRDTQPFEIVFVRRPRLPRVRAGQ